MNPARLIIHCAVSSILHPRTSIKITNPNERVMSPIPWWGSIGVLVIGIVSWGISAWLDIEGLNEAARAMVYLPLGNIFGMTTTIRKKSNISDNTGESP